MFETFHFLRPEWLFALPLIALFLVLLNRHSSSQSGWEDVCDPALLAYQLAKQKRDKNNLKLQSLQLLNWITPLAFLIGIIALSGPSWEKKEQPVFQQGNALVIILDLSLSMNATDLKPSRLKRAKLKLIDILQRKKEGQTALIAFAGDAHTVSPLTIDNKTIKSLLPALNSSIMPLNGTHLLDALDTAKQLFKNAGFAQGDILLLSDGIEAEQFSALKKNIKQLHQQGYRFSVIGIGTSAGSPLPLPNQGGFIKDQDGQVVLSKLDPLPLKKLTSAGGGQYKKLSLGDSDFETLLAQRADQNSQQTDQDKQLEQWIDAGAYFTLLLIPLALMSFRKGLFSFILCLSFSSFWGSLLMTESAYAETTESAGIEPTTVQLSTQEQFRETWKNLWTTPEQQAQKSFNNKDYQSAADQFSDNNWKASANYRVGNFKQALKQYSQSDDAHSLHNKGNTLANLKQYQEAIDAYEEALKKAPGSDSSIQENTTKNLNYVKKILEQQKKQSSEKSSDKNEQDKNQPSDDQEQEQENSTDDGSKSNESEESEENKSDDSSSEGNDSNSDEPDSDPEEDSSEKDSSEKDSSEEADSEKNSPSEKNTPDSPQSPEEAKSPEESNPEQKQEDQKELVNQSAQPDLSEKEEQDDNQSDNADKTQQDVLSQLSQEEQQSLEQWLKRIPDNPGELLRIKFRNNTILKQRQSGSSETQYEGNPW